METNNTETVMITGDTYPARAELKAIGGVWVAGAKGWKVEKAAWEELRAKATPSYSRALCKALRGLVVE